MTLNERLGGKGYKPRKDYAGRRVSGDWENSDRGGGNKWQKRVGKPVKKKSPTYLAYIKNKENQKENVDIDWKIKNTLNKQKTDHTTGNFSVSKRWMSDQERVAKSNAMMTGVKMDADGLVPDAGAFYKGHLDKAINTTANMLDGHKGMRDKVANKFNVKNIDGATFRSMASNATKDTAFNINKNIPGTQAHRYQGVANSINAVSKSLKASYEPEGEFLSYEEVEIFVESLSEQGYTEEQILLELDRRGFGPVILGKGLELGMGAIKNTIKFGKATRGVVNRAVSDTKLLKKIDTTARTLRGKTGNTFKGFKDKAGSIAKRVRDKLSRTDIKSNTPSVTKKPVEVLGGSPTTKGGSKTLKNVTPNKTKIGNAIKGATDNIKTTATNAGKTVITAPTKVSSPAPAAVTNSGKKEVTPTKNPVVKKTTGDGGKAAWLKKTSKSPAARSGAFTDDERWNTQLKHRAWKASRQRTKVDESVKDELLSKAAKAHKKAKNFKKWRNEAEKARQTALKPGEVRWMDKKTGKWKSNKK